jgi:hypothetical protein
MLRDPEHSRPRAGALEPPIGETTSARIAAPKGAVIVFLEMHANFHKETITR